MRPRWETKNPPSSASSHRLTIPSAWTDLNRPSARIVSAEPVEDDLALDSKLSPQRLNEFIGQRKAEEQLSIALEAARNRGEAPDHLLISGPPSLGKIAPANIIAN